MMVLVMHCDFNLILPLIEVTSQLFSDSFVCLDVALTFSLFDSLGKRENCCVVRFA
jgi:hypothetical protein